MKLYVLFFTLMIGILSSLTVFGQTNLLKDFGCSPEDPGWNVWAAREIKNAPEPLDFPEPAFRFRFERGKLFLRIPEVPFAKVWFAQVRQHISLIAGKKYRLHVKVKAENPGIMAIRYELDSPPWKSLGLDERINVSQGEKIYTVEFTASKNTSPKPVAIKLLLGMLPGNITVSEIKLELIK